jgi:3-dehydroquinate synthase
LVKPRGPKAAAGSKTPARSKTPAGSTPVQGARRTTWMREVTGYPVTVAPGARRNVAALAAKATTAYRFAIITDETVRDLYAKEIAATFAPAEPLLLAIPSGEMYKTRESWARLTDQLLASGYGRDSAIIAIGGGVVGDLAGFVAATFMRGIPFIQVPTTLLAMIDASIGGKTGVDTQHGKNLVGAFHRPAAVIVDPTVLATLPPRELRAGLAEAIKHGVIADGAYLERIEKAVPTLLAPDGHASAAMIELIIRSIEVKAGIVERDEHEGGLRKVLNFGHTLGHAVESLGGYELLHGEAISIGMALEAEVGERAGISARGTADAVRKVLEVAGLPSLRPLGLDPERLIEVARGDKKTRAGSIELAVPLEIGAMAGENTGWAARIGEELIQEVLEECAER